MTVLRVVLVASYSAQSSTPSGGLVAPASSGSAQTTLPSAPINIQQAIDAGDDCPALFELRNQSNSNNPSYGPATKALVEVGCRSATDTRGGPSPPSKRMPCAVRSTNS